MNRRPWPLVILAICHLFAPALNIAISAWLSHMKIPTYVARTHFGWLEGAEFWLFLPLAGVAIFLMKRWSYGAFLALTGWVAVSNFFEWHRHPSHFPLWVLGAIYTANALTVGYFILPAVRKVYFDARLRWWEAKARYRVDETVMIRGEGLEQEGRLCDLSEGGALLKLSAPIGATGALTLDFTTISRAVHARAEIVHARRSGEVMFYGVRFIQDRSERRELKALTRELDRKRVARRPGYESSWGDFKAWAGRALRTGQGLVPEPPSFAPKEPAPAVATESDSRVA